ncbi:MAG: hypothetical protein QW622_02340 [Candidatus Pacearchaeota archaeon]
MKEKKGIEWSEVLLWGIVIAALIIIIVGIFLFKKGGGSLLDQIINLFRFR